MQEENIQYPPEFTNRLEVLWGEGFLSPGGAEEVREILRSIDLQGKSVLDIGCGTGGVEVVLAKELGAGSVTGIDVEPQLIECSQQRIEQHGLQDRVSLKLVEPGPFDFPDNHFDVVFSKDSMIHIADKNALFKDVLRVLKPGGQFAASDWLVEENAETSVEWKTLQQVAHLNFEVATSTICENSLTQAGFSKVRTRDRNDWYAPVTQLELEQLEGPLREDILSIATEESYQNWLKVRRALRDAVHAGALRPTHLFGTKPG